MSRDQLGRVRLDRDAAGRITRIWRDGKVVAWLGATPPEGAERAADNRPKPPLRAPRGRA